MNKTRLLSVIVALVGAAMYTYSWFQAGVRSERDHAARQQEIHDHARIKVAFTIKQPNSGYLFSEVWIPLDAQVVIPTDIGTLTFKHESPK